MTVLGFIDQATEDVTLSDSTNEKWDEDDLTAIYLLIDGNPWLLHSIDPKDYTNHTARKIVIL